MKVISVIVPVYNSEKYVARCIESVLAQTFHSFELILVDDGSTDQSGEICDNYAVKDSRIKVIHQQNKGVSAARNAGIKASKGDWVTFVDSDDLLVGNCLKSFYQSIESNNSVDLVYCGYAILAATTELHSYYNASYVGRERIRDLFCESSILFRCSPWAKMYRRSIIIEENLLYNEELSHSEDRLFVYNYLQKVKGITTIPAIGYVYSSISPISLKHKPIPLSMLSLRQREITNATMALMRAFNIENGECFMLSQHLIKLLVDAITKIYYNNESGNDIVLEQNKFFESNFNKQIYDGLLTLPAWQKYLQEDKITRLVVGKDFKSLNKLLKKKDTILRLHQFAGKILRRRKVTSTVMLLNIINQ